MSAPRPHSSPIEPDPSDFDPADEFFSADEPTPPQGTEAVDLSLDGGAGADRPGPHDTELARSDPTDLRSGEDTAMLPVVEVDLAQSPEIPLDDPLLSIGEINPISPDPPDPSAFRTGHDSGGVPGPSDASARTGQFDALTPDEIAGFAPANDGRSDQPEATDPHEATDQHDVVPSDDEPTAVTTVVDAILAEDDLAPLDPEDGVAPPPIIDQPDAEDELPPATAEFSLADIAAQGEPEQEAPAEPATAELSLADIAAQGEPEQEAPAEPATAEFSLADIGARGEPEQVPTYEPEAAGLENIEVEDIEVDAVEAIEIEAIQIEAIEIEAIEIEAIEIEAIQIEAIQIEATQIEAIQIEPAPAEAVGSETAHLERQEEAPTERHEEPLASDEAVSFGFELDFAEIDSADSQPRESGTAQSEAVDPTTPGTTDPAAASKRRGLFGRRRDRHPTLSRDDRSITDGLTTTNESPESARAGAEGQPVVDEDEPIFISPADSLFAGPEPNNTDDAPDDEPRPRRKVTLPPDSAPPDSWSQTTPTETTEEPLDSAADPTTPRLEETSAFFDRSPPAEAATTTDRPEMIGWPTDQPETSATEQPFALFQDEREPQDGTVDEVSTTSHEAEVVAEPPTEATPQLDTDTETAEPPTEATPQLDTDTDTETAEPPTEATPQLDTDTDTDTAEPPTEATPQLDTDTDDAAWAAEWDESGWDEAVQAEIEHDADHPGEPSPPIVPFSDQFPPVPPSDSDPPAPAPASALDGDWERLPLDADAPLTAPDDLSLFDTKEPTIPVAGVIAPQAGSTTDSEFFSLEPMLDGLPEPDEPAPAPMTLDHAETAPDRRSEDVPASPDSVVAHGPADVDVVDLAELPEEPGRVLEDALVVPADGPQWTTGSVDAWTGNDVVPARRPPSDDIFGELADLDTRPFDDLSEGSAEDRSGGRVEGHDWWDFDDATQRSDDRGGFRAAANATEAIDFSGTEQLRLEASDLAAPPTGTKSSDLDALDGPDSDAYEAALYAFFDAPGRDDRGGEPGNDESSEDDVDPELDNGFEGRRRGKREGKAKRRKTKSQAAAKRAADQRGDDATAIEADLFAKAQAMADDDRDDVDRWVEGTTDTHADWLERTKRSTFSNLLGVLIALAAVIGVVLATVWLVSNI